LRAFADAEFRLAVDVERTGLTEGLEEAIKEDLGLALFVAGDVFPKPRGEISEFIPARHGWVLPEKPGGGNLEAVSDGVSDGIMAALCRAAATEVEVRISDEDAAGVPAAEPVGPPGKMPEARSCGFRILHGGLRVT
jgi:hypothetical protein